MVQILGPQGIGFSGKQCLADTLGSRHSSLTVNEPGHFLGQHLLGLGTPCPLGILTLQLGYVFTAEEGEITQELVHVLVGSIQPELVKGVG